MKILLEENKAISVNDINILKRVIVGKSKDQRTDILVVSSVLEGYFFAIDIDSPLSWGLQYYNNGKETLPSLLKTLEHFEFEAFGSVKEAFAWLEEN